MSVEERLAKLRLIIRRAAAEIRDLESGRLPPALAGRTPRPVHLPAPEPAEVKPAEVKPAEVRRWARHHGIPIAARGRIPEHVLEQHQHRVGGREVTSW